MSKKSKRKAQRKVQVVNEVSRRQQVNDLGMIQNGLGDLVFGFGFGAGLGRPFPGTSQLSSLETAYLNNRYYLISNHRQILNTLYAEHGIIQTLIDQPVDDAFRKGFEIQTGMISTDEKQDLIKYMKISGAIEQFTQAIKWKRLFGGAGMIIVTGQKPDTKMREIQKGDLLGFRAADLWELFYDQQYIAGYDTYREGFDENREGTIFTYYSTRIHPSRVLVMRGKEPPSYIRKRLRGWGMSEVERIIRSFNKFLKNGNAIFDLLDEAKVDVMKLQGLNAAVLTPQGTEATRNRLETAAQMKNFLNMLVMDKEDDYDQKSLNFSGLSDTLTNIRQEIASDLKMPITKLFGVSATGFNSGEDDIENYNSMVESEIREKEKPNLMEIVNICAQQKFGIKLEDLDIEFPPLRVLSAEQEENVKDRKFNRLMSSFSAGVIDVREMKEGINKENLLPIEIKVNDELFENPLLFNEEVTSDGA